MDGVIIRIYIHKDYNICFAIRVLLMQAHFVILHAEFEFECEYEYEYQYEYVHVNFDERMGNKWKEDEQHTSGYNSRKLVVPPFAHKTGNCIAELA